MDETYGSGAQEHELPSFILVPLNTAAKKATEHVRNNYFRCSIDDATYGLWVGFDQDRAHYTLGSRDTDIYLPNDRGSKGSPQISPLQAAFHLESSTGAVLLWDYSEHGNTEPFASSSNHNISVTVKFRGSDRSVLVARGINSRVAFGRDRHYQFELRWQSLGLYGLDSDQPYTVGPRKSSVKKYIEAEKIGGGAYGAVWACLDITTGTYMAVKKFHNLTGKNLEFATREVANLFKINKDRSIQHEHILQILDSAGGSKNDSWGEIFMPLMSGSLKTLVDMPDKRGDEEIADAVLRQMLLALQCIASHNIVHRDIKPENILWTTTETGEYHFCLGDFGLSNDPNLARTVAGTEPFMAPEVYHRQPQSTKVDIWSLFATVAWVRNTGGFRDTCSQFSAPQIHAWLRNISARPEYSKIRRMAQMQPKSRPTAQQQLTVLDSAWEDETDYTGYADVGDSDYQSMGAEFADDNFINQFEGVSLDDDSGYGNGPESGHSRIGPEIPYYEPYTTRLMDDYPWEDHGLAGPSTYQPPGSGDGPREHTAYVAPYANVYAPAVETKTSDDATAVPETWPPRPLMTAEEPMYQQSMRDEKRKGRENRHFRR